MAEHQQEYKGTSKLIGGLGGWMAGSLISSIVTIPLNFMSQARGNIVSIPAVLIGLSASIYGAVKGVQKAENGKKQFLENQQELAVSQAQSLQLVQIIGAEREQNRKFTDLIASRDVMPIRPHADLAATVDSASNAPKHHAEHAEHAAKTHHEHASEAQVTEDAPHHPKTHATAHAQKASHLESVEASRAAAQENALAI